MMRFASPEALQALWLLPIVVAVAAVAQARARARLARAFGKKADGLASGASPRRRRVKLFLSVLALGFLALALARPQSGKSTEKIKSEGIELMFVVDVSNSMLAEDVKPSRIEHAKAELSRLLDLLGGDKVGIVAFAGSATLVSPLTADKSALKMFLESLSPQSVETQGTEFRKALREARNALERGGIDPDEGAKVTRAILIASDGEDQEPGALDEARKLADDGIRVFTMAFGTERGAPIPMRDERGYLAGYKRDKSGQTIQTQVKGDFLRALAQTGRGSFYHVTFGGQEAKAIRADIDRLEKTQFDSEVSANYDERFQAPLLVALLLGLLELLLSERSSGRMPWRGRFVGALLVASLAHAGFAGSAAEASQAGAVWDNNRGVSRFQAGKPSEAYRRFSDAVSELPDSAQAHINLGTAFAANKDYEKALEEYTVAERMARDPGEKLRALFGSGVAAGELKRVDEALDYYQRALELAPQSKEIKTNIELLAQSGGGGEGDDQKQQGKSGQGEDPDQNQGKGKGEQEQKQKQSQAQQSSKPKPYDSKEISQQDVNKILDELKQQEGQVRAKYQREGAKDAPRGKDW
jgi:Ca-activated chloride channel family protein